MKKIIGMIILLSLSISAHARTYIQCNSYEFDDIRMVLSIKGFQGTMFITNGVHLFLMRETPSKKIWQTRTTTDYKIYESRENQGTNFELHIPKNAIETYNNNFDVFAFPVSDKANNERLVFSCFNNIFDN